MMTNLLRKIASKEWGRRDRKEDPGNSSSGRRLQKEKKLQIKAEE